MFDQLLFSYNKKKTFAFFSAQSFPSLAIFNFKYGLKINKLIAFKDIIIYSNNENIRNSVYTNQLVGMPI